MMKYHLIFKRKEFFTCHNIDEPWEHYVKLNKSWEDKYLIILFIGDLVKIESDGGIVVARGWVEG